MKRLLFLLVAFLYCNATWLAVVWTRDVFHPVIALFLILLIPIGPGVVLFLIFSRYVSDDWSAVFVGAGVLIPVVFLFTGATRIPDYLAFVRQGRPAFDGRIADVTKDDGALFYSVRGFAIKDPRAGHFGASYSSSTRKNSTSHAKHFVIPLFANPADPMPRAWIFGSYTTGGLRVDDGAYGLYGLDQTGLLERARGAVIHGVRMAGDEARGAVSQYLRKMQLPGIDEPIILRPVDQPAAEFYGTGERQLQGFTVALNLLFLGVCIYASRAPRA